MSDTVAWNLFEQVLAPRVEVGEDLQSMKALGETLAVRRAEVNRREVGASDFEFVFALFCWWPVERPVEPNLYHHLLNLRGAMLARVKSGGRVVEGGLLAAFDGVLALSYEEMLARRSDGTLAQLIPDSHPLAGA